MSECHNSLAYLSSINLIITIIYVFCAYTMSDDYVIYDQDLKNLMYSFCALSSVFLIYILSVYNKYLECQYKYISAYKFLLLIVACVLTYFGFTTIHVNEIRQKN